MSADFAAGALMPKPLLHTENSQDMTLSAPHPESGNVIFFILLAVVLIGLVTVAIRSGGEGANIDRETVSIRASQIREYASELERAITFIMQGGGVSETEIRFAHPDAPVAYGDITATPTRQVFSEFGGGAAYRLPPTDISGAANWEFYGHTHLPDVGVSPPNDRSELVAVLPNVTRPFCNIINEMNGYTAGVTPEDTNGVCLNAGAAFRFSSATGFSAGGVNDETDDDATWEIKPATQGCVTCNTAADDNLHFFHVLMAR